MQSCVHDNGDENEGEPGVDGDAETQQRPVIPQDIEVWAIGAVEWFANGGRHSRATLGA